VTQASARTDWENRIGRRSDDAVGAAPRLDPPTGLLGDVGFQREATLPESAWLDGRPVDREIWGVVRND